MGNKQKNDKKSDSWVAGYDPNDKTSSYRI